MSPFSMGGRAWDPVCSRVDSLMRSFVRPKWVPQQNDKTRDFVRPRFRRASLTSGLGIDRRTKRGEFCAPRRQVQDTSRARRCRRRQRPGRVAVAARLKLSNSNRGLRTIEDSGSARPALHRFLAARVARRSNRAANCQLGGDFGRAGGREKGISTLRRKRLVGGVSEADTGHDRRTLSASETPPTQVRLAFLQSRISTVS